VITTVIITTRILYAVVLATKKRKLVIHETSG
jgi:hypothetical protein